MLIIPEKQTLEWSDVYPFLYFHIAFEGVQESKLIKHLVIDEMQDYTPIQYVVINRLFPCQKTILGDFGQRINPNYLNTIQDMLELYHDAGFVELTKSYRSTYEIITFANSIQHMVQMEAIERHGDIPQIISCKDDKSKLSKIKELLASFLKSEHASLGIILKTNSMAKSLHNQLSPNYETYLISPESTRFSKGISITSIHMSKGLEFDEVIVLDINEQNYNSEYDRSLLYIAATRAMHKLTIIYTGKPSQFLFKANHE